MIAAALAALKSLGVVRWIWDHRAWLKWLATALLIAALTGIWRWERHDRLAAEAVAAAASTARDLALEDVARWRNASDLRDAAIGRLDDLLARQNAAVLKLQFSRDAANQAAVQAEAAGRDARTQFDRRVKEIDDEAKAHPEDVVPLGRIVRGRVDRLWD